MTSTDLKFAALAVVMALAVTGATLAATTPVFGADSVGNGAAHHATQRAGTAQVFPGRTIARTLAR